MKVVGVDFTSAPKPGKRISIAICSLDLELRVQDVWEFSDFPSYELWLGAADHWIGGFDFPFGLPRRFVEKQKWPADWPEMVRTCVRQGKEHFVREAMAAFKAARTPQDKHRLTDLEADSHSPLKTNANPPVGRMFYEGAWRLLSHGIRIPVLNETESGKIALEAYPGLLAGQIGFRHYKNDKPANAKAHRSARRDILRVLHAGTHPLGVGVRVPSSIRDRALLDGTGDTLDAILCAVQAAWAVKQPGFGIPANIPPCEGWIVSAGG